MLDLTCNDITPAGLYHLCSVVTEENVKCLQVNIYTNEFDFATRKLVQCISFIILWSSLGQWEADWQMKFNVAKCYSLRVTWHQHHKQILFDYSLHNQTLENVQSTKYLGIAISDNIDWDQHISEISS